MWFVEIEWVALCVCGGLRAHSTQKSNQICNQSIETTPNIHNTSSYFLFSLSPALSGSHPYTDPRFPGPPDPFSVMPVSQHPSATGAHRMPHSHAPPPYRPAYGGACIAVLCFFNACLKHAPFCTPSSHASLACTALQPRLDML